MSGFADGGEDLLESQSAFIHWSGSPLSTMRGWQRGHHPVMLLLEHHAYGDTARQRPTALASGSCWEPTDAHRLDEHVPELRCAADLNRDYFNNYFSDQQLWAMTTHHAAIASATDDVIGALQAGLIGDIAIFDRTDATSAHAAVEGEAGDVALVIRGGQVLYGDADVEALLKAAIRSRSAACSEVSPAPISERR